MLPARRQWIVALLHDWGFNTVGCWSSPSVWPDFAVAEQIYVDFRPHAHDVFDAAFWQGPFADHLREEVKPFRGQPNVLGYFLDNEPAWNAPHMFAFYLRLGKHTPGSRALLAYLKTYYQGRISLLNHEWGTSYRSFAQIPGTRPPPRSLRRMQHGIVEAWRTKVVATYYQRYATMVRALDPEHLILGIRYKSVPDMALFTALSPSFDVNSINDYTRSGHLKPVYAALYQATGKPLMITEFSFSGFPAPGQPSALFVAVGSQANRGLGYHTYVRQAARAPFMVGMHWFMWSDYAQAAPMGGYPHPPDVNVGLVTADEAAVYEELEHWIMRTNAEVEAIHRGSREASPSEPVP
jgi:agarase